MISPRNVELPPGTVNNFHWRFKPVLSLSKSYSFSTFREEKSAFTLSNQATLKLNGQQESEKSNLKKKYKDLLPVKIIALYNG